jgi:hypothetical protein
MKRNKNKMEGTEEIILYREAEEPVTGNYGRQVKPLFYVRCNSGKKEGLELYLFATTVVEAKYGTNKASVRLKFDEDAPVQEDWGEANSRDALFSPNPNKLAKQLLNSKHFYLEFTPFQARPATVEFDVSGLKEQWSTVTQVCGSLP